MARIKIPINERICASCGGQTTTNNTKGNPDWRNVNGECWCRPCHKRKIINPKWNPIHNPKYSVINNPKRVKFKGKDYRVKDKPRTGFCNLCKKNIGEDYINCKGKITKIKQTHIHHINYHDIDILKDTIELCASCHRKVSVKKIEIIVF